MTQELDLKTKESQDVVQKEAESSADARHKRVCLYAIAEDYTTTHKNDALNEQLLMIQLINNTPNWKYERLYMDSVGCHDSFKEMIADCEDGKYDIIVTKTFRRFAETLRDTLNTAIRMAELEPPVEIIFTDEAIFTSDTDKMENLNMMITETCYVQERAWQVIPRSAFRRVRNRNDTMTEEGE